MDARKYLGAYLSREAHDGWHQFARQHDVDASSLLEAVGIWLSQQDRVPAGWRAVLAHAKATKRERSRRGR